MNAKEMIEKAEESRLIEFELQTRFLGTVPYDKTVYASYIATKAPKPENGVQEVEDVQEVEERGWTGFLKDEEKGLYMSEHMIKGFIKNACYSLQAAEVLAKIPAYKTWMDNLLFVFPRKIFFNKMVADGVLERPMQVDTPKGKRVTITRSDYIEEGSKFQAEIRLWANKKAISWDIIEKCLNFGERVGFGQWRGSGGYGRFTWRYVDSK